MRRLPHLLPLSFLALATYVSACASRGGAVDDEALATGTVSSAVNSTIAEVTSFGSNPGALKMFEYAPAGLKPGRPLVLVLHGCTETAASSATTGWNDIADEAGFLVVYPQQETANNPVRCFNWAGEYGDPADIQRGKGENLSIKQMVDTAVANHGSDPTKVFIVGFSAGGGMAAIMAATYPEVFAGAATMAGLPYNCTTTYAEVNGCIKPGKTRTAAEWATLVKDADPGFAGTYPRMSIWQGAADTTVGPANRMELVKQWTGVHGVDAVTPVADTVDGQSHAVYKNAAGHVLVETYEVAGMAHGVPVVPAASCGATSTYALDKGICASRHIASFFGITSATPIGDAGADAKKPGTSGGLSSSSSTGGVTPDAGHAASGSSGGSSSGSGDAAPAAGDPGDVIGRHGSTCTVARGVGSSSPSPSPLLLLGCLLTLTIALARSRARTRSNKAVL